PRPRRELPGAYACGRRRAASHRWRTVDRREEARAWRLQLWCARSRRRARLEREGLHLRHRHEHRGRSALTMASLTHIARFGSPEWGGFLKEARAVIEARRTSLMVTELIPRVRDTQVFLRMAAIELRRIAEQAPDIAVELRHVAQQLEAEAQAQAQAQAQDLARRDTE